MKKYQKYMAVLLGIALIVELAAFYPFGKAKTPEAYANADGGDERKIAADISNMTGVSISKIMEIKKTGKTWNEVIQILKTFDKTGNLAEKERRNQVLTESGLEEEDVKQLTAQGYSNQEITESKLLAERVQFQIKEMTAESPLQQIEKPHVEASLTKKDDDRKNVYRKIAEQFSVKLVVTFMLKLKKDYGDIEAVMDEYLLSLQLDLDLEDYSKDKQQYQRDKEEKKLGVFKESIVTLSVLEQDLLEKMKTSNNATKEEFFSTMPSNKSGKEADLKSPIPDVPIPVVKDVRPQNPGDAVRKEIDSINPNKKD
ncbi:hypothetical protein [Paenibacillus thalictri]|uniref:hypothetical protein n=1 Tax=Paenibacillus thalictri TaxID=2527873 RepID=UPI001033DBCC|nr:hypothetical protein [Paenibacillus thalictri]